MSFNLVIGLHEQLQVDAHKLASLYKLINSKLRKTLPEEKKKKVDGVQERHLILSIDFHKPMFVEINIKSYNKANIITCKIN